MKFCFFTLYTTTTNTLNLSHISSLSVVLWKPSLDHQIIKKNICLSSGVNTFRNAIGTHYLAHYSEYVATPSLETVRKWFSTIGYGEVVEAKGTLKKSLLPPRWRLLMAQIIQCLGGKTRGFDQITNKDDIIFYCLLNGVKIYFARYKNVTLNTTQVFSDHNWALKNNQPEGPPFTDHMLAICKEELPVEHKAPNTSSYTRKKDSKGKSLELNMYIGSNQLLLNITTYPRLRQPKDHQVDGGPTYLGVTSEGGADTLVVCQHLFILNLFFLAFFIIHSESALGCDALEDSITEADLEIFVPNYFIPQQQELEKNKAEAEVAFLTAQPLYPNVTQLTELLVKSLQPELSKILSTHNFRSSLPTELKELPSKFNDLTEEVKGLKKHVYELKIKLPGDLKEIPNKLETFTSTAKIETMYALLSLLNKVTEALNKFALAITYASKTTKDASVPSAGQASTQPAEGEKNTNQATISQVVVVPSLFHHILASLLSGFENTCNRISSLSTLGILIHSVISSTFVMCVPDQMEFCAFEKDWLRRIGLGQYGVLGFILMDTAYDRREIRHIRNCLYAFSCEELALICHISFPGYDVLENNGINVTLFDVVTNLNKQQSIPTPPITTTTTQLHHYNLLSSPVLQRAHLKLIEKDKDKKAMSLKDAEEEGSDSESDDIIHLTGSRVESSRKKKLKKFDLVT
nr:hypothetical protein [Tanacetum cinerariifolium]